MKLNDSFYINFLFVCICLSFSCSKTATETTNMSPIFSFTKKPSSNIIFLSTQLNPVEEAAKMRNIVLKEFPGKVDFRPNDNNYIFNQIDVLFQDQPTAAVLIGALHSDLEKLWEDGKLQSIENVLQTIDERNFSSNLLRLAKFDGNNTFYIPWMQASYIMIANKKALPYLPNGATLNTLTYDQLYEWGINIYKKTGKKGIGFPSGEKGLMHRFFQGYLYPSYTQSTLLKFRSSEAVSMWEYFKNLWQVVNPSSLAYSTMSEPLLAGDILIAWDHTARVIKALEEKPNDFIVFPTPVGPKGRGVLLVISGLAIPSKTISTESQSVLIDYLTQPTIQNRILKETGFFPVIESTINDDLPLYLQDLKTTVAKQLSDNQSILVLMPMGLGNRGSDFNDIYMLTFSRIVLQGQNIMQTLNANTKLLQNIINEQNAKSWLPDISDKRPCQIE